MSRWLRLICVFAAFVPSYGFGGDYLIRLEKTVQEKRQTGADVVEKTRTETFEIFARQDVPFLVRHVNGGDILLIKGKLEPAEKNKLRLHISFMTQQDDEASAVVVNGVKKNGLRTSKVETQVELDLKQKMTIGGLKNQRKQMVDGKPLQIDEDLRFIVTIENADEAKFE